MPVPWKMPPRVKIYEAIGALGDGRVTIVDDGRARVTSSDKLKAYEVETSADGREVSSNDNASYWQGYIGYPAIAVLIKRALISQAPQAALRALSDIPWKDLNRRFKNDYAKTIAEAERIARERGHDLDAIRTGVDAVMASLEKLRPHRGKRLRPAQPRAKSAGKGH